MSTPELMEDFEEFVGDLSTFEVADEQSRALHDQQPPRERHHGVREDPEIAVRRLVDHFGRDLDENHVLVRPLAQQLREASAHSPFPSAEHL